MLAQCYDQVNSELHKPLVEAVKGSFPKSPLQIEQFETTLKDLMSKVLQEIEFGPGTLSHQLPEPVAPKGAQKKWWQWWKD